MTNKKSILKFENISKSFENQLILNDVSIEIIEGETIAIVGPSGIGKTTFLNLAGTIDQPDSGNIFFNQENITSLSEKERSIFRNKHIGFIFQLHYLLPQCTVLENILIPTIINSSNSEKKEAEKRAIELLYRLGMSENRNKLPGQLSGGECQRTAFIRALINQPELILADEPTGSLDEENAIHLISELIKLNKELNTTLLLVTHSTKLAEQMDKILYLKNHKIN
jgi:ABC-type lipoprotein export system ATPase subunit